MKDVIIDGTLANPKIKVGLKEFMQNTMDAMKKKAEEELLEEKEELERKARKEAEKKATQIIEEADNQTVAVLRAVRCNT